MWILLFTIQRSICPTNGDKGTKSKNYFLGTSICVTQGPFPRYLLGRTLGRTYLGILIQLQLIFHSLQENNWLLMKYDCLLCYFKQFKSQRICKYSITSKATRNLEWEECGLSDSGLFWSGLMPLFFSLTCGHLVYSAYSWALRVKLLYYCLWSHDDLF